MSRFTNSIDLKVVVLGAASVGKTSLINRYCNGTFQDETLATIGAGFYTHTMVVNNSEVTLMIWDTAGEERFRSVAPSLLRGASGIVLVYDLHSPESFKDLNLYMEMFLDIVHVNPSAPDLPILVLGNKSDLEDLEKVPQLDVDNWMKKNRVSHLYEVSAKTGANVEEAFQKLVDVLLSPENIVSVQQLKMPEERKGGCRC